MTLRDARIAANMTQVELATVLGVTRSLYSQWECGAMRTPCWVRERVFEQLHRHVELVGEGQRRTHLDGRTMPGLFKWDEPKTDRHLRLAQMVKGEKQYIAGLIVLCCRPLPEVDRLLAVGQMTAKGRMLHA